MTAVLSVVIVLYNSAVELGDCLESLQPSVADGWAEVLLVDNASPDASVTVANRVLPDATLITLTENRGFAGGVNAALSRAQGPYVLLLNPDVIVPAGGLRELVRWLDGHPGIGVVSPSFNGAGGHSVGVAQRFPSSSRTILEMSRLHKLLPKRLRSRLLLGAYWDGRETVHADWVPGTALLTRREVIDAVGPMSETMFMYGEDIEWCWRIRKHGYGVGVDTRTPFSHVGAASTVRTWGDSSYAHLVTRGIYRACLEMYGSTRASVFAIVTAVSLLLESWGPGRTKQERRDAVRGARLWLSLVRGAGA